MSTQDFHLGSDGRRFSAWGCLTIKERNSFIAQAFVFFPEVLGSSTHKYQRFAEWLASRHGILCTNVRDVFGAGGRKNVSWNAFSINSAPKVLITLFDNASEVRAVLCAVSEADLAGYFQVKSEQIRSIGKPLAWAGHASLALEETMKDHPDCYKLRAVVKDIAGLQA